MYDKGDPVDPDQEDEDDSIEVYRAVEPPSQIYDFIVVLKAYTKGLFQMKTPETLKELRIQVSGTACGECPSRSIEQCAEDHPSVRYLRAHLHRRH